MMKSERKDGEDLVQANASTTEAPEKVTLPSEQEAFLLRDFNSYRERGQELVGAYRAGLSSALIIVDELAEEYGMRTKSARSAHGACRVAGNRIEGFRNKCTGQVNFSNEAVSDAVQLNQTSLLSSSDTEVGDK